MKSNYVPARRGFTLVELLVVIVIIATLAALSLTLGPRMMAKARATESLQNLRQIGPVMTTYAADHSMKLPPAQSAAAPADGSAGQTQWTEVCLAILYPDATSDQIRTKAWWEKNKPFMRNPMFKETAVPRGWTPLNPGYAVNEMIAENILKARQSDGTEEPANPLELSVSLASIPEPDRTPLIAPCDDWHYRYDETQVARIKTSTNKDLLIEGNLPVLFVDGHVESMPPAEYLSREFHLMPKPAGS